MVLEAARDRYDPVAGREAELDRVIQILLRRSKNNPVLLGDPGVGKTAVAEALARRMALGLVPEALQGHKLLMLDLGSMIAGTKYRGEFEDRMKKLIREAARAGDVILFLDELHTILGAGGAEGAIDGANLLKPALARGELRMIGASTGEEYRRLVEKDPALERRFQPVRVEEPDPARAREILDVLLPRYSRHHGLLFQPEALDAAVELSVRYLPDRRLPDKAIDLLDEAASSVRMGRDRQTADLRDLESRVIRARRDQADALAGWDRDRALQCREAELDFRRALEAHRREREEDFPAVTAGDVARVVAQWTGIPVASLTQGEREKLLGLEETLRRRVTGQEAAVAAVARAVRRGRTGLREPGRPAGVFLFLGPTGVGKTELCKALAQALFGREDALLRFDMTEFSQPHTVSRLTGAPPGYVGHESGGQLTDAVRERPWSVVLFDELEKAHPDVWGLLLQIMEEGVLTDSHGRKADFRNTVVVMTSNVGGTRLSAGVPLGFSPVEKEGGDASLRGELRQVFRPEFLGRLDEIVFFRPLEPSHMEAIARKLLSGAARRLAACGVELLPSARAISLLAEQGADRRYGARPLRRLIRTQVEDPAAELLLREEVGPGGTLYLDTQEEKLVLSPFC